MRINLTCKFSYLTCLPIENHGIVNKELEVCEELILGKVLDPLGFVLNLCQIDRVLDDIVIVRSVFSFHCLTEYLELVKLNAGVNYVFEDLV